jgi:hypothetical protein
MKALIGRLLVIFSFLFAGTLSPAFAVGGWADSVVSSEQGLRYNGSAVPAVRSNPSSALGVAEGDTADGHFFSLGFGGKITLQFNTPVASGGVLVVEATTQPYPDETATVEFSSDNVTWSSAQGVVQDGQVTVPGSVSCAQYVRITDTSNRDNFADYPDADAYDVDGVELTGNECTPVTPTPSPTPEITATPSPTPFIDCPEEQCPTITPTPTPVDCNNQDTEFPEECVTPTATPTPQDPGNPGGGGPGDGLSDGRSDGGSSCPSCTQGNGGNVLGASTGGQVLGASTDTLAATGSNSLFIRNMLAATAALVVFLLGKTLLRVNETS